MAPGTSEATEAQGSGFRRRACLPCWERPRVGALVPGASPDSVLGLKTLIVLVETELPVPDRCILGCLWAASLRLRFIQEASGSQDGCRDVTPPGRVPALHVSPAPACG